MNSVNIPLLAITSQWIFAVLLLGFTIGYDFCRKLHTKMQRKKSSQSAQNKNQNVKRPVKEHILLCLDKILYLFTLPTLIYYTSTFHWNTKTIPDETIWEKQWKFAFRFFNGDPFSIALIGTTILTSAVFWIPGTLYLLMDITGKPHFLHQYKIQPDKNNPVQPEQLKPLITQILINQICVGIPFFTVIYYAMEWRGCSFEQQLPNYSSLLFDLFIFVIIEEITFYYSHRLLHHPSIYKHIHKRHHEWIAPVAISAVYAHPVEFIFSNLVPIVIGPLLLRSHITTFWIWLVLATFSTMNDHSGYHFPLLSSPEFHDFHHLKFNQNYGLLGILDWLHGTDDMFKASKASERHYLSFGFTPLRTLIPDKDK